MGGTALDWSSGSGEEMATQRKLSWYAMVIFGATICLRHMGGQFAKMSILEHLAKQLTMRQRHLW